MKELTPISAARSFAFSQFSKALPPRITITKVTTILKNHRSNLFFTKAAKRTRHEKKPKP